MVTFRSVNNDMVQAKIYPGADDASDPLDDGLAQVFEREGYAYNCPSPSANDLRVRSAPLRRRSGARALRQWQGQPVTKTDRNGTVHGYDYDRLGRELHDRITAFADHIDATVRRISRSYNKRGLLATIGSYDDAAVGAGSVLNEVGLDYDDFGQLKADQQEHGGAVTAGTPQVGYAHEDGSNNTVRRTALVYPDGRQLDYGYGAPDSIDDLLSRAASLKIAGESDNAMDYAFAGLRTVVKVEFPEPGLDLSYIKQSGQPVGDAGDQYTRYDRFDQTVDMPWRTAGGSPTTLAQFQWGHDRVGKRNWRRDVVAGAEHDEHFGYDGLYQLSQRQLGTLNLNQTAVGGIPLEQEGFAYDPIGNWDGYQKDKDGTNVIDQSRTTNRDNQSTQFDGSSAGVAHDKAGNAILMPPDVDGDWSESYTLIWDGWNRLVKVEFVDENGVATIIAAYAYDGLFRRIIKTVDGKTKHFYFSNRWKPIEEREGTSGDAARQYVWGARAAHRDELILRDSDTNADGTLDERLYALMDYYNGTAIVDASGAVQERYEYSAFGLRMILAPDFSVRPTSAFDWEFGFKGQFIDPETGYTNYGFRYYTPETGRWLSRDPIGERGGMNLYLFSRNNGMNIYDLLGLKDQEFNPEIHKPENKHPGTSTPFNYINGRDTTHEEFVKDPANAGCYNCHSMTFHDKKGDPTDPANNDPKKAVTPLWDDSSLDDLAERFRELKDDENVKVGDVCIYHDDKNNDGILDKGEDAHSATVTEVDKDGNAVRVEGKQGTGPIVDHHPGDYDIHGNADFDRIYFTEK